MTKTRSQMKGKSLLSEIPRFPKRAITKKKHQTKPNTATKKNNNTKTTTKKRQLSYAKMVRETLTAMSTTSSTSSKAVSNQAIARYLTSHFGVEVVNQTHLAKVLQQGVESGALRKVKRSFLLTSKSTNFGVSSPTKKRLAQPSAPQPTTPQPTKRRKVTPAPTQQKKKKRSTTTQQKKKKTRPTTTTTTATTTSPSPSPTPLFSAPSLPVSIPSTSHFGFPSLGEEVPVGGCVGSPVTPSSTEGGNGLELTLDIEKNMLGFDKEAMMTGIASVEAKKGGAGGRPPCDIVAVVDRSGSMMGAKLALVKEALCYLVSQLGSEDRLSVVSFDHQVYDVFGLRVCSEEGKKTMTNYINNHPKMQAGGMTNIRLGLEMGMSFLKQRTAQNPVSAVMLLTDGHGGAPDQPTLQRWENEVGGVPIHCFGFGVNHDARALANIGEVAHGSFTFVENINTVGGAFATCLGGVLSVTAQQVVLRLESEVEWATIQQVHTTYPVSISANGRQAEVTIPDTISEEKKDIVLSMKVGVCPQARDYNGPLFSCHGTFLNVRSETGRGTNETIHKVVCDITRPVNDSGAVFSMRVDQEKNRIEVAEALKEAVRLGESNNLVGAQQCLESALARLEGSPSGKDMGHLKADLLSVRGRFQTRGTYEREGYAFARQQEQSHRRQRAVGGAGGEGYCNGEQIAQRAANATFRS